MGWEQIGATGNSVHTATGSWILLPLESVTFSGDRQRVRGIVMKGTYSIDQTTEANSQSGLIIVGLMRFPRDATPNPTVGQSGVDQTVFTWRYIWSVGQNNPVHFTMRWPRINVRPGFKLDFGSIVKSEVGSALNHRLNVAINYWRSDD